MGNADVSKQSGVENPKHTAPHAVPQVDEMRDELDRLREDRPGPPGAFVRL